MKSKLYAGVENMEISVRYYDKLGPGENHLDEGRIDIVTPLIPIKLTSRTSQKYERLILYFQHRDKWVVRLHLETPEELELLIKKLIKIREKLTKEGPHWYEIFK